MINCMIPRAALATICLVLCAAGTAAAEEKVLFDFMDGSVITKLFEEEFNTEGYRQSLGHRWVGSTRRDLARNQLRVPNGSYEALHVIATGVRRTRFRS